jgi:hypothetical protein
MPSSTESATKLWTAGGIQRMLDHEVRYKDWKFVVQDQAVIVYSAENGHVQAGEDTDLHLRAEWHAPDSATGKMAKQQSRWWRLSKHMVKTEIINTAFACVKMAEEHELRETFQYLRHGKWTAPYNTHIDIDTLADWSHDVDVRMDTRPNAPANQRRE